VTDAPAAAAPAAAEDEDPAAPASDPPREELLAQLLDALGDGLVEHHLAHGRDLWIRVDRDRWQDAGRTLRDLGYTYFGFLSAIDWMVAPEGRYEDTEFEDEPVVTDIGGDDDAGDGYAADGEPTDEDATDPDAAEPDAAVPDAGDEEATADEDGTASAMASQRLAGGKTRFQVLARVQKPGTDMGVTLKVDLPDGEARIDTWTALYRGANWHEREAWEMFGIDFAGHPGLRHIYLPSEFEGHPLRKDYPLLARVVKPWPGVVDIEDIPPHLESQLEAEVMAAFEATQAAASSEPSAAGEEPSAGGEGS